MFAREVIARESSSTTTTSPGLNTTVCARMKVLRIIYSATILCLLQRAYFCAKDQITWENVKKALKFFSVIVLLSCAAVYYLCLFRRSSDVLSSPELTKQYQTHLDSMWQSHLLLEEQIRAIEAFKMEIDHLHGQISGINKNMTHCIKQILEESEIPGENKEQVLEMIDLAIKKYEDPVQMADWAQKTLGATIDKQRTSGNYDIKNKDVCWFMPWIFCSAKPPDIVLEPDVNPGNCWAFQGSEGQVVIKLPQKIQLLAVTVEHIPKAISPSGNVSSAMKDFVVSGLDNETDEETLLGMFTYDIEKETIQTFHLKNQHSKEFLYVKFKVWSNWGNSEFTCIYRLRVHGNFASHLGPLDESSE
ncbi:SUN domain-containing protein 3-like isoform X2 [Sphaerodactylus townsendi]|nr:SUN domain-containing protein 3-like isoform X2 [Sphaerodactylus townsendi]XP_048360442.1 SUN domain-containing protein 3-like isoform X2 [Sphaerodactylus townsendi]